MADAIVATLRTVSGVTAGSEGGVEEVTWQERSVRLRLEPDGHVHATGGRWYRTSFRLDEAFRDGRWHRLVCADEGCELAPDGCQIRHQALLHEYDLARLRLHAERRQAQLVA